MTPRLGHQEVKLSSDQKSPSKQETRENQKNYLDALLKSNQQLDESVQKTKKTINKEREKLAHLLDDSQKSRKSTKLIDTFRSNKVLLLMLGNDISVLQELLSGALYSAERIYKNDTSPLKSPVDFGDLRAIVFGILHTMIKPINQIKSQTGHSLDLSFVGDDSILLTYSIQETTDLDLDSDDSDSDSEDAKKYGPYSVNVPVSRLMIHCCNLESSIGITRPKSPKEIAKLYYGNDNNVQDSSGDKSKSLDVAVSKGSIRDVSASGIMSISDFFTRENSNITPQQFSKFFVKTNRYENLAPISSVSKHNLGLARDYLVEHPIYDDLKNIYGFVDIDHKSIDIARDFAVSIVSLFSNFVISKEKL